ncbi:MAG TPA: hypothetical protein VH814_22240 [Steroidobacteraceae bacterium]|jgi:hypothetical protein
MSDPKDRDPGSNAPPAAPADDKRSGRAGVDERGNSVWEWQLETGVYSRDISTQRLKKLDLGDLSIATGAYDRPPAADNKGKPPQKKLPGGGFNPYDSSNSGGVGGNPYDNARSVGKKTPNLPPVGAPPARKPMDLKRLEEWMQIRKRLEEQKKNEDED